MCRKNVRTPSHVKGYEPNLGIKFHPEMTLLLNRNNYM